MDGLIIFGAKYLYLFEIVIIAVYFLLQRKNRKKSVAVLSAVFLPLAYIIAKAASLLYFNPRPFVAGNFTPLVPHSPSNGFPSEHMLLAGAIASIIFVYNKKLGVIAWIIAFVIGAARVFAGVHHWTDIIASAAVVVAVMWLVKKYIMPRLIKSQE